MNHPPKELSLRNRKYFAWALRKIADQLYPEDNMGQRADDVKALVAQMRAKDKTITDLQTENARLMGDAADQAAEVVFHQLATTGQLPPENSA